MAVTVRTLVEDREKPISVQRGDSVRAAMDLMLRHDFTQLPVVDESGRPFGLVTSDSILRMVDSCSCLPDGLSVAGSVEPARTFDLDDDISDVLQGLRDRYAVLVIDAGGGLIAILTGFDIAEYLRDRNQDLMHVEDIEIALREHVRQALRDGGAAQGVDLMTRLVCEVGDNTRGLRGRFRNAITEYLRRAAPSLALEESFVSESFELQLLEKPKAADFDRLTFGQYRDLLFHPDCWPTAQQRFRHISKDGLRNLLDKVRNARNALAHFREISPADRSAITICARLFNSVAAVPEVTTPDSHEDAPAPPEPTPGVEPVRDGEGRYARLAVLLQAIPANVSRQEFSFAQIEQALGGPLPQSATEHRSWWANSVVAHQHSQHWLDVGWRVSQLSMGLERVVFDRIQERQRAYIDFFGAMLGQLRETNAFRLRGGSPYGTAWHSFGAVPEHGAQRGIWVASFGRGRRFRVELYLDAPPQVPTKALFDELFKERESIGSCIADLSWERMDDRRASRIALYRPGSITDDEEQLEELAHWGSQHLERLAGCLSAPVERLIAAAG